MPDIYQGLISDSILFPSAIRTGTGTLGFCGGSIGALQGIALGAGTALLGDSNFGRHLQIGVVENLTDGSPFSQTPCLQLSIPGFWRFRWSVKPGVRSIYINSKQSLTSVIQRPTMVIKANPTTGLLSDMTGIASNSSDWVTIGPLTFTCITAGSVWVELHNNCYANFNTPALFDHITAT